MICDRFQTMPRTGGLFDQDSLFVYILDNYLVWESEKQELENNRNKNAQPKR